jgi:RNA polymerase-binding transcription factor DksA
MSDLCDDADILIEQRRDHALAQIPRYTGISAKECECGEEIPEGRRVAIPGVQLCAGCQSISDLKAKGVRRG